MVEDERVETVTERQNTTLANVEDSWAETATSILFSVLLFLVIYLAAKLYGLVKEYLQSRRRKKSAEKSPENSKIIET